MFALLKKKGWATSLSAGESGGSLSSRSIFMVHIELTDAGQSLPPFPSDVSSAPQIKHDDGHHMRTHCDDTIRSVNVNTNTHADTDAVNDILIARTG